MHQSDLQLMERIQNQDADAFDQLFARYQEQIARHAQNIVRDNAATEDLVQEIFLRVWTRAEQWEAPPTKEGEGIASVRPWLYRIATNLSLNHLRAVKRRPQQSLDISADDLMDEEEISVPGWMIDTKALQPDRAVEIAERQQQVRQLISELPEDRQMLFHLVYDEEMDMRSVANQLGIPEGTVKSRLYYSKQQIARKVSEDD